MSWLSGVACRLQLHGSCLLAPPSLPCRSQWMLSSHGTHTLRSQEAHMHVVKGSSALQQCLGSKRRCRSFLAALLQRPIARTYTPQRGPSSLPAYTPPCRAAVASPPFQSWLSQMHSPAGLLGAAGGCASAKCELREVTVQVRRYLSVVRG